MSDICPYFNSCGGCDFQDKPYEEQLRLKEEGLKDLFSGLEVERMVRIVPSPDIWYYRNKMEYIVGPSASGAAVGLRRKKSFHKIVDLDECRIFYDGVGKIFSLVKSWMRDCSMEPYNLFKHKGTIRYVALRHSKFYHDLMIMVVVSSPAEKFHQEKDKYAKLVEYLKGMGDVESIFILINNRLGDTAAPQETFLAHGEPSIKERINGIDYLIEPSTFFQTNSLCCERLYSVIKDAITGHDGTGAVDLYCGSGGIALQVADGFDKVLGIDMSAKNIETAAMNAAVNGVDNVKFIASPAEKFLLDAKTDNALDQWGTFIVDPPRAGLAKDVKSVLLGTCPRNVIYVSCNPESLKNDLKDFLTLYRIKKIMPVDMFPHTRHVECVAVLSKK